MVYRYEKFKEEITKNSSVRLIERHLTCGNRKWIYNIDNDNISQNFILVGLDHTYSRNFIPKIILKISRDEIVRGEKFWKRFNFCITNDPKHLLEFKRFNITDKVLGKVDNIIESKKGSIGYYNKQAKIDGFDNYIDWIKWRKDNGKLPDAGKIDRIYEDVLARKRGYKDGIKEYDRDINQHRDIYSPKSENEFCTRYLGEHIGENIGELILIDIFGIIEKKMPSNNVGYDYIVNRDNKVDVKTAVLGNDYRYKFTIDYNSVTDYFLLLGIYERDRLNLAHALLIKGDEMIRKKIGGGYKLEKFYNREGFSIYENSESIMSVKHFRKYDYINKLKCLDQIKELCNIIRTE